MLPHLPYTAEPKTTYYFRPYNYQHIAMQKEVAQGWGAPPSSPYSNGIFDSVYAEFEKEQEEEEHELTEPVVPLEESDLPTLPSASDALELP